jgi:hypothetical protein
MDYTAWSYSRSLVALWTVCVGLAQTPQPAREVGRLNLRQSVDRTLEPGQADLFTVELSAGQFVHVIARKKGAEIVLSIRDPSGQTLLTRNSGNVQFGTETASWIAPSEGVYSVRVATFAQSAGSGHYEIELGERGEPSDRNHMQIRAEETLAAAISRERAGSPVALRLYEEAVGLWRNLNDTYQQAVCLQSIGRIYFGLGQKQKALEMLGGNAR